MYQVPGPISARLLLEHGEDSPAWTYVREEETTVAVAGCGYRLGCRWRSISPAGPEVAAAADLSPALDRPGAPLAAAAA